MPEPTTREKRASALIDAAHDMLRDAEVLLNKAVAAPVGSVERENAILQLEHHRFVQHQAWETIQVAAQDKFERTQRMLMKRQEFALWLAGAAAVASALAALMSCFATLKTMGLWK